MPLPIDHLAEHNGQRPSEHYQSTKAKNEGGESPSAVAADANRPAREPNKDSNHSHH